MDGFFMETPIKMDDLGVPLFLETPKWWFNGDLPWFITKQETTSFFS